MASLVTLDEFIANKDNSTRVVGVQWRKSRRPDGNRLLSHSFLQADLADGRRLRVEKLVRVGLQVSELGPEDPADIGEVYRGRHARLNDLVRPLGEMELRELATVCGACPYSLRSNNCHHFARDVWNALVVASMRKRHYPDRLPTNLLKSVTLKGYLHNERLAESVTSLACLSSVNVDSEEELSTQPEKEVSDLKQSITTPSSVRASFGRSTASPIQARTSSKQSFEGTANSPASTDSSFDEVQGGDVHPASPASLSYPHLSFRQEEAGRLAGDFSAREDTGEEEVRLKDFERFRESGALQLLELGTSELRPVSEDLEASLMLRVTEADAAELVSRIPLSSPTSPCGVTSPIEAPGQVHGGCLERRPSGFRAAIRASFRGKSALSDIWFVLLRGSETRLAIYAIVKHGSSLRRLRMLSGDAQAGSENFFSYSLRDINADVTAADLVSQELESMRTALATNEWGFLTLL
mmetsp:Transcript_57832/g.102739  ORF Transcript_57832/g.102739 Transcript_57832/m.102739 type:complete len:468 (-) Transcript_57832:47-1450(-)